MSVESDNGWSDKDGRLWTLRNESESWHVFMVPNSHAVSVEHKHAGSTTFYMHDWSLTEAKRWCEGRPYEPMIQAKFVASEKLQ